MAATGWLHGYAEGEYVRLGAPAAGWLQSVPVQRGDRVEQGALLFELEDGRQRAAVAEAEAQLARGHRVGGREDGVEVGRDDLRGGPAIRGHPSTGAVDAVLECAST